MPLSVGQDVPTDKSPHMHLTTAPNKPCQNPSDCVHRLTDQRMTGEGQPGLRRIWHPIAWPNPPTPRSRDPSVKVCHRVRASVVDGRPENDMLAGGGMPRSVCRIRDGNLHRSRFTLSALAHPPRAPRPAAVCAVVNPHWAYLVAAPCLGRPRASGRCGLIGGRRMREQGEKRKKRGKTATDGPDGVERGRRTGKRAARAGLVRPRILASGLSGCPTGTCGCRGARSAR